MHDWVRRKRHMQLQMQIIHLKKICFAKLNNFLKKM